MRTAGAFLPPFLREVLEPQRRLRNGLFESLIPQTKNKKGSNECFLFVFGADYETRSARFCARRHAPDRRTVPRTVLCFATVFSSLSYHNQRTKKEEVRDFFFLCLWSGLRDSNSLPSPWQGDALPDELNPQLQNQLYRYLSVLSRPKFIFDKLF